MAQRQNAISSLRSALCVSHFLYLALKYSGHVRFARNNSHKNTGPPSNPVNTPTGNKFPSNSPRRDTGTAHPPPSTKSPQSPWKPATAGADPVPTTSLPTCGQTNPTNPIGPLIATAAAVISDAATKRDPPQPMNSHSKRFRLPIIQPGRVELPA